MSTTPDGDRLTSADVKRLREMVKFPDFCDSPREFAEAQLLLSKLLAAFTEQNNAISWDTTCLGCGNFLTRSLFDAERIESLEDELAWFRSKLMTRLVNGPKVGQQLTAARYYLMYEGSDGKMHEAFERA